MTIVRSDRAATNTLSVLLVLYAGASLLHFVHNAEYLSDYPNLPVWLSRAEVYVAWCILTGVGALGYALYRLKYQRSGLAILALYAASGFDGLLHYARAPLSHHTAAMNFTIWTEVVAAALLLTGVASVTLVLGRSAIPKCRWSGP